MPQDEALALITDLTAEATETNCDQRWTIIPASYRGRPFHGVKL